MKYRQTSTDGQAVRKAIKDAIGEYDIPETILKPEPEHYSGEYFKPHAKPHTTLETIRKADVTYSKEIADTICERMIQGESLLEICNDPIMPRQSSVYRWLNEHTYLREKYSHARETMGHTMADRALQAALAATPETASACRTKFDGLKWYAAKVNPRVYGERIEQNITFNVGLADRLQAAEQRMRAMTGRTIDVPPDTIEHDDKGTE